MLASKRLFRYNRQAFPLDPDPLGGKYRNLLEGLARDGGELDRVLVQLNVLGASYAELVRNYDAIDATLTTVSKDIEEAVDEVYIVEAPTGPVGENTLKTTPTSASTVGWPMPGTSTK